MASLLGCAKAGMEKGWMDALMSGWMDGWMRPQLGIPTREEKDRSWGKQNKDQIKEIFWFCKEF